MAFDHGSFEDWARTDGAPGFGSSPRTKPKSMWKKCPSCLQSVRSALQHFSQIAQHGPRLRCRNKDKQSMSCVIMMLSKCRSPIPSKYVAMQYLTCTITQTHAWTWTHICLRNRSPGVWPCSAPAKLIIGRWHWTGTWLFVISSLLTPNGQRKYYKCWSSCQLGLEQLRDGQCFFRNWLMSPSNSWTKIDIGTEGNHLELAKNNTIFPLKHCSSFVDGVSQ